MNILLGSALAAALCGDSTPRRRPQPPHGGLPQSAQAHLTGPGPARQPDRDNRTGNTFVLAVVKGGVLASAGGFLVAIGALLPWERLVIPPCGSARGCFGPHGEPTIFIFYGSHIPNGRAAMIAGAVMAAAGLSITAFPAVRPFCAILLAGAIAAAAAAAGGWWLKPVPGAVIAVGAIEAGGVLIGLAALPLCLPGSPRRRAWLLAATVLACVIGVALVRPGTTPITVSF